MFSKRDLLDAIAECEENPTTYPDCMKLATFYTLYDHLYPSDVSVKQVDEVTIGNYGSSDFLSGIVGCDAEKVWTVIDELMSTIKVMQPRLYDGVMRKIGQTK